MKKLKYLKLFESWDDQTYKMYSPKEFNVKEFNASYTDFKNKMNGWKIKFDIGAEKPVNTKEFIEYLLKGFENMGRKLNILGEVVHKIEITDIERESNTYVWFGIEYLKSPVAVISIGMIRPDSNEVDKFLSIYYSVEDKMWSYSVRTQYNEISYDNSTKFGNSFGTDLIKKCLTEAGLIK